MDGLLNAVKDSVMESVMGNKSNKNDESSHGKSNAGSYSSTLDGTANTYAESRADIENQFSSGVHHDRHRQESDSYKSYGHLHDNDSYKQQDHSHGTSDYRREDDRRDDDSSRYSGYGGQNGRSQEANNSTYGGARGGLDSIRDTRGTYSRHDGFSRREYEDNMRGSSRYEVDEDYGYGGHGGRPGNARQDYDDRFESGKEHRPAQGSSSMMGISRSGGYGEASRYAQQHFASGGDESMYSNAVGYISGRERELESERFDEGDFTRSHRELYGNDSYGGEKSSVSLGQAAAMQALKYSMSDNSDNSGNSGIGDQNTFIGMAMAEAAKLFDSQSSKGNVSAQANKQDVINQAARMAVKLFLKSKLDASGGSGGAGGLMNMASKFLH